MICRTIKLTLSIILIFAIQTGCSSGKPVVKGPVYSSTNNDSNNWQMIRKETSSIDETPSLDDLLPYPYYVDRGLWVFAMLGIDSFYRLNKRVPVSFDEYVESGMPMIMPNDYITGKPYRLSDKTDLNDTTGFSFISDGVDICQFDFVVNNDKTGKNEKHSFKCDEEYWRDYKIMDGEPGLLLKNNYDFDWVKREYCLNFFLEYSAIYMEKYKTVPKNLNDMFKNEGIPIEKGWRWMPESGKNMDYFEFGIDTEKARVYHIIGCKGKSEMPIVIYQLYDELIVNQEQVEGINIWEYKTNDVIPSEVIDKNMLISSDSFFDGYLEITS